MDIFLPAIDTVTGAESGRQMSVILPNGQTYMQADGKTPVSLELRGADSKVLRDFNRELTRKRVDRGVAQGTFEERMAEAEDDSIGYFAAATLGWSGITDSKGKAVPFTVEAVKVLYAKFPAIRDQVEQFIGTRANFTPRSLTVS